MLAGVGSRARVRRRRLQLLLKYFDLLDRDGSGSLDISELYEEAARVAENKKRMEAAAGVNELQGESNIWA